MKIVVDENIPFAEEAFGRLGEVLALPGRAISYETIQDATILIVRSVTRVNAVLLQGSAVQFVGSATAGCDHIDQAYLDKNKILFASAAGANANSVAEYVICALLMRAQKKEEVLRGKTLGIIGVGHVGALLKLKAEAIGMIPILNDPPLQRETEKSEYRSLQEACDADFISLHVPLNDVGEDATQNLLSDNRLRRINPKTVIINTSRGEVIDPVALFNQVEKKQVARPILDVWANEPSINWALLEKLEIGTPHIAGYSLDGKVAGTQMVYEAACAALGVMPSWSRHGLTLPGQRTIEMGVEEKDERTILNNLCTQAYDLSADVTHFMALGDLPLSSRSTAFEHFRKTYTIRREFQTVSLTLPPPQTKWLNQISGLGFKPRIPK